MDIQKPTRSFVEQGFDVTTWEDLQPYFESLLSRQINSKEELLQWLKDQSELEAVLEENAAWRYIRMTVDTRDKNLSDAYTYFISEIQPKIAPYEDKLNRKLIESIYIEELSKEEAYSLLFKRIQRSIELFREENIPILAKTTEEAQKYGALSAAQTIDHDGETLTMQKANLLLKEHNESLRKEVFEKMSNRRLEDRETFDNLMDSLIANRHQIAVNAGFNNYRDYKMEAMCRFDYSVSDCEEFHASIKQLIVPIVKVIQKKKLALLGKDLFKPWDLQVDPEGRPPLKPFEKGSELIEKTIEIFNSIDPYFGDCIRTMDQMQHLDLESKQGKAPGGYNYPLYEIGVPFIFMNAVGSQQDVVTMVHEGGHAVHSFLSRDLELTGFKNLPSEVAELASMSMELLTMDKWSQFYNAEDHKRAQIEQLESVLKILPWIAQVDEFQHWIYVNHEHTQEERTAKWMDLNKEYGTGLTDWSGFEHALETSWQRQLHIFEVPFYYIEYGIAQLGALGVWKNSMKDFENSIDQYKNALSLAYTKGIPNVYNTAGIEFNFKPEYLKELADFVHVQLAELYTMN